MTRPTALAVALALSFTVLPASGGAQESVLDQPSVPGSPPSARDAYLDPAARVLHEAARARWDFIDESVARYTAVVKHRISVQLRTPLKDRTLFRAESASRVLWDRDRPALVQVLGQRVQTLGFLEAEPEDVTSLAAEGFDPAGERLFFFMNQDEDPDFGEPGGDDFWVWHPLAPEATEVYRFATGDTLVLSLPDGRRLEAVELLVLPREIDVHRVEGAIWIEPRSGSLVRAVYRLSEVFDALRDLPELREEMEDEDVPIPGLFKPWTFDLRMIAVEYALWDFDVWLPRSMRMEGTAGAGILKAPAAWEVAYDVESVVTEDDLAEEAEGGGPPPEVTGERHFATRSEAMAYMAELAGQAGVTYEPVSEGRGSNRYLAPSDRTILVASPHLPPPIWEDAPGFASEEELEEMFEDLARVSGAQARVPTRYAAYWGLQRPDLVRYNRIEGPAVGGQAQLRFGSPLGPLSLEGELFVGAADLELKPELSLTRETLRGRQRLSVYAKMVPTDPDGRYLGVGNSANALLFGRDDGEYYRATGASLLFTPPSARRRSWSVRLFAERHEALDKEIDFALFRSIGQDFDFRPNVVADEIDEAGAAVRLSPWWGTDPLAAQTGFDLDVEGALGDMEYGRAALTWRLGVPFGLPVPSLGDRWRLALEAAGGESWGELPLQRSWFLGSARTLRGYPASTLSGPSFARARLELARVLPVATIAAFSDAGWTGDGFRLNRDTWNDALVSVGAGASLLDGLVRFDVARGLRAPTGWRVDFYLDAAF